MYVLLTVLIVIASILMCLVVLVQNSKGGGLSSGFSSSNQIMGVRKTTEVIEKITWGLAAFIVVISIATAHILPKSTQREGSILEEKALQDSKTSPVAAPAGFDAPKAGNDSVTK